MNNASSEEPFLLRSKKRAIPLLSMALAGPTPATIPLYPSRLWIPYTNSLQSFSKEVLSVGFMELSKLLSKLPPRAGDSNSEQHSPATAVSDFGSVATPLNVLNLHLALRNHPNMDFVKINNACNFGKEVTFGYSGPKFFVSFRRIYLLPGVPKFRGCHFKCS